MWKYIDTDADTDEIEKDGVLSMVDSDAVIAFTSDDTNYYTYVAIHEVKPYLFPLSSMTEEQNKEYNDLILNTVTSLGTKNAKSILSEELNFYCKYHLDFRGLIPKGLANDATGLNIY